MPSLRTWKYSTITLSIIIGISVFLNGYFVFTFNKPVSSQSPTNVTFSSFNWVEYPQENNFSSIKCSFGINNFGDKNALVLMVVYVIDFNGVIINEYVKTGEYTGFFAPAYRYFMFQINTGHGQTFTETFTFKKNMSLGSINVTASIIDIFSVE